jgi:hypothetical protein
MYISENDRQTERKKNKDETRDVSRPVAIVCSGDRAGPGEESEWKGWAENTQKKKAVGMHEKGGALGSTQHTR